MRIITSFDRNALEEQRVDLAMEARNIQEDVPTFDGLPRSRRRSPIRP